MKDTYIGIFGLLAGVIIVMIISIIAAFFLDKGCNDDCRSTGAVSGAYNGTCICSDIRGQRTKFIPDE